MYISCPGRISRSRGGIVRPGAGLQPLGAGTPALKPYWWPKARYEYSIIEFLIRIQTPKIS